MTAPSVQEVAAVPSRITGFRSTVSGRNGSRASLSHHMKAKPSAREAAMRMRMVGDIHGTRAPPDVSAMRNRVAAAIISAAPTMSS
jgi:hydrogenase maturation factor HypE